MDRKEVLRYLRTASTVSDEKTLALVDEAMAQVTAAAVPKSLYRVFPCEVRGDTVTVGGMDFQSKKLAQHLAGCPRVAVFGATLGLETDRLIQRAMATDTARGMAYSAAASAYIEEVCDRLETQLAAAEHARLRQRYSPGYYDLDITAQQRLFQLVALTKRIGITLTETCQMIPSKSVTAFIGIEN